jgi:hypothetical protein
MMPWANRERVTAPHSPRFSCLSNSEDLTVYQLDYRRFFSRARDGLQLIGKIGRS